MPYHPSLPKAPLPTREIFDPFNSSSTGHQTAPSRHAGSTSWRESRSYKLARQFQDQSGGGGSQRLSDLIGAGSENWKKDGRKENGDWEKGAPGLRESGWQDIRELMSGNRKRSSEVLDEKSTNIKRKRVSASSHSTGNGTFATVALMQATAKHSDTDNPVEDNSLSDSTVPLPQIFRGLTMFLNGSTAPEVSDHKIKQLFVQRGGNSSIALGRRTVTHVILGKTCGGGLASSKIHKEVIRVGGKGIKYVTAQWVLDSVEKGIRQPEGRYMPQDIAARIGGSGQNSVKNVFITVPGSDQKG